MNIEELDNYAELAGLIDPSLCPHPDMSKCFVLRNGDREIKGYCFTQAIICIEPMYVAPDLRGSPAMLRLFDSAKDYLKSNGQHSFYCHATDEKVKDYLLRVGTKPAGESFIGEL